MSIKKHIPNFITCGNLLCGCLAIIKIFEGELVEAAYLVGIALVFDFFDGFAARQLKVTSPIGKDLDSLADLVTFGVVPGMMMFKMIGNSMMIIAIDGPAKEGWTIYPPGFQLLPYVAFIIIVFSAIRLAKFNNDTRQSDSFIGLPTPANAMTICSLPLIAAFQPEQHLIMDVIETPWFLTALCIVMSLLLVSEIPLIALKFKNLGWADNKLRFIFLALCVVLILIFRFMAIPLLIILYILLSIVDNIFLKKKV